MECKIIICSHKRAGEVKTKVAGGILFVSESQAAEYRACNPDYEIETHPDSLIGLPAKRQACVDRFKPCFMMDDDLGGGAEGLQESGRFAVGGGGCRKNTNHL